MKCAFFDRDGIINEDRGYVHKISDFIFCKGLFGLLDYLKKQHYLLIVVTNQSGIERGLYTKAHLETLHHFMQNTIKTQLGFSFDKIYFCPHAPESQCDCRKPNIGMIRQACADFDISLEDSLLIGDKITDMQCAKNAGIKQKYLLTKNNLKENEDQNMPQNTQIVTSLSQLHSIISQNH